MNLDWFWIVLSPDGGVVENSHLQKCLFNTLILSTIAAETVLHKL